LKIGDSQIARSPLLRVASNVGGHAKTETTTGTITIILF